MSSVSKSVENRIGTMPTTTSKDRGIVFPNRQLFVGLKLYQTDREWKLKFSTYLQHAMFDILHA